MHTEAWWFPGAHPCVCTLVRARGIARALPHRAGHDASVDSRWTALNLAVVRGHTQVVKMLLEQGFASGDIPDNTGATAVLRAAELGRTAMLEALLEAGADPDAAARVRCRADPRWSLVGTTHAVPYEPLL